MSEPKTTMKAVVFHGPGKVSVEDRPIPQLQTPKDIIVKVQATALCGSELHMYRGHEHATPGFVMGHEFTGTIVSAGADVKTLAIGDTVVAPFTVSCAACFYCRHGLSSRCEHSQLFGSPGLDGAQAEFVRVPFADGTAVKAPAELVDNPRALILMADIFPTGFYGAKNAFSGLRESGGNVDATEATVVVVGCGPVGLCAIVAALEYKPKHLFAVDSVKSRLELARGWARSHAVVEVVGLSPALRTAYELLRPFGVISCIGVHNAEIPWSGEDGYNKNLRIQMGRCPVRSVFLEALAVLVKNQHKFSFMFEKMMPLSDAVEGYDLFDKMKVQKVVFKP
ncbi:chaperonin 10-like protein [Bombardia bombarda]|uniref:Chaperonin 10-like protein n=1 Tax=Bombardia bombarda TaxID=252184 RepID=A0AA39XAZ3_9PEZI|nr:chaperonin 10-like protein [Bombardia bombarda]